MKIALLAYAIAAAAPAAAVTLDFDSYAGSTQIMTDEGFDFGNFYALDTSHFPISGYVNGVVSPAIVAYNGDGRAATITSATPFSLTSGYLAAAWNDGLTVQLVGSLAGHSVFTQSFTVDTSRSRFEVFDPALIDKVEFTTSGGVHHAGYNAGIGTEMSLDNLTINGTVTMVPEPRSWAMMFVGFGLVGLRYWRRVPRLA